LRNPGLGLAAFFSILIGMIPAAVRADIVGPVPSDGPPLRIRKNAATPQHLDLTWGDSCGQDQNDFAVYEGTIGAWYSHTKKLCTTAGALGISDLAPSAGSRYYLIVALSTTSEGSYGTSSAGAEIPLGISTCRPSQSLNACGTRVFVSSIAYGANLGGLGGADTKCQTLANASGLSGTWKAWLSDSSTNAFTRLTHGTSYRRIDGALIADGVGFFSTTHLIPIDLDEHGSLYSNVEVWTGSGGTGTGSGGCADWTSTSFGSFPTVGLSDRTDSAWSNVYLQFCDRVAHLYCIEQ
jgi:hypothetical protein